MIVALAGRRVDAANAEPVRFPLANVNRVRDDIRAVLQEREATTLVSSAACGADLLGQQEGRELGIRRIVMLPYPAEVFRERSVTDRPGDWGRLFDELVTPGSDAKLDVVHLNAPVDPEASQSAFERTNEAILDRAISVARAAGDAELPLAIVVWDGAPRGPGDLTNHFRRTAMGRGMAVVEVLTR